MLDQKTVAIVDDDIAVGESLEALLAAAGHHVRRYNSGVTFLADRKNREYDCILMDVIMPSLSGLEVQRQLQEAGDKTPILIITGNADVPMAVRAMQAGAFDLVEKPYQESIILEKVESALSAAELQQQKNQRAAEIRQHIERLTEREKDVLKHLGQGLPNKAIARELDISHRTVEIHRARVMQKMDASSLAELVTMLFEVGYGHLEPGRLISK